MVQIERVDQITAKRLNAGMQGRYGRQKQRGPVVIIKDQMIDCMTS